MLSVTRSANLPRPEVNAGIVLPDNEGAIQGDFVWREQRLIVETDGHSFHGTRQAFERDRRRDQRLTMHGGASSALPRGNSRTAPTRWPRCSSHG